MRLTGFLRDVLACRGDAGHGGGVCIIRPDGIGDYILFRPFLPLVRAMFPGMRLTLCANTAWVALSMRHDAGLVDKWVAIDRGRLKTDRDYAARTFAALRAEGFDVALNPLLSRDYISDILTFATRAARRETPQGDLTNQPRLQWTVTGMLYTARHALPPSGPFEMHRTHAFLECVAGGPLAFPAVAWPPEDAPPRPARRPFVLLSLGASVPEKRWPAGHHAEVAAWVTEHAGLDVVLCGGDDVRGLADSITANLSRRPQQGAAPLHGVDEQGDPTPGASPGTPPTVVGDARGAVSDAGCTRRCGENTLRTTDTKGATGGTGGTGGTEYATGLGPLAYGQRGADAQNAHGAPRVIDAVGAVPLADLPAMLRQAAAVVTHDSAVYHLALACGRPTICIADGRGWQRFTPWPADLPGLSDLPGLPHLSGSSGLPGASGLSCLPDLSGLSDPSGQVGLSDRGTQHEPGAEGKGGVPPVAGEHPDAPVAVGAYTPAGPTVCLNADGALKPIDRVAPARVIEALGRLLGR